MSDKKMIVTERQGYTLYDFMPAKRSSEDFDLTQISSKTKDSFKNICVRGNPSPQDFKNIFASILGNELLDNILE